MKRFFRRFFFPLALVLLTVSICLLNYTPGTWLTGWDTLHPEFDFILNFKRVILGVWRGDQGLGAVAAHAHMVELPRLIILWFFSIFAPDSILRYLYIFLCFILGPLGVYVFLKRTILAEKNLAGSIAAFLGALFYLFNLGTVQHFFVPFEMFMAQYASLGWLFYFATEFVIHRKTRDLIFFAIVSFFASSMAYASLLWYAYAFGFVFYLFTICLIVKQKHLFKAAFILLVTVFVTNAYWLLPNWYFLRSHAIEVPNATTNMLFSEEAFLHNKQYGNIKDAVIFKNFLFNWSEQTGDGLIFKQKMLAVWDGHLANPFVISIGYIAFFLVLGGVVVAFFDRTASRQTLKMAMFPLGLFSLFIIINMNPPFSYITDPLREQFAVFKEGLRFPWTKFSMLLMFAMSVYFALFWQWLFGRVQIAKIPVGILISILLAIYCWPMFQGQFIDRQLRIGIPHEYFSLFKWINSQEQNGRVAPLPMHSPWGWDYYSWGYQGSGFLWFGIKQPVLARDFDRWNPSNEQYYRLMSTALYARDVERVEALADAYQIRYFILDENVIFSENKPNALWFSETKDIFAKSKRFHLAQKFEKISVYTFDLDAKTVSFTQTPSVITSVGPVLYGGYQDPALQDYPNYIADDTPTIVYPFRNLVDRYGRLESDRFLIDGTTGYINLGKQPIGTRSPNWENKGIYPSVVTSEELVVEEKSQLVSKGGDLMVAFPVSSKPLLFRDKTNVPTACGYPNDVKGERKIVDDYVSYISAKNSICDYVAFPATNDIGYLLVVESRNNYGLPMRVCISTRVTRRCDIYFELTKNNKWTKDIFVIPPYPTGPFDTSGIDVSFSSVSIGNESNSNDMRTIQLIPFPYFRLHSLSFTTANGAPFMQNSILATADKERSSVSYTTDLALYLQDAKEGFFVLNQAYEDGWIAYTIDTSFPFIHIVKDHMLFNNWANGWKMSNVQNITFPVKMHIFFIPQLLEFVGFLLLLAPIAYILYRRKK